MKKITLLWCLTIFPIMLWAQKKRELQLFRFYVDNDYLNFRGQGTDRYYSSGAKLDFYYTKDTKTNFFDKLLIQIGENPENLYGYGITQLIYTPSDLKNPKIISNDRPYVGVIYLNHSLVSSDKKNKQRLITEFDLGTIGKYAFAEETQKWLHRVINDEIPAGWDNQIASDIIINYNIRFEKMIFNPAKNIEIIGLIESNTGTLSNNVGFGITFRAGLFNNYFSNFEKLGTFTNHDYSVVNENKKHQFYFYMKPVFSTIMDNSLLEGGFFTHNKSPHTIYKDSLNRALVNYEFGIMLGFKRFGISASEKLQTAEYKDGPVVQTGNITFYIGL
jgi:lipid A 3-O-deacylase